MPSHLEFSSHVGCEDGTCVLMLALQEPSLRLMVQAVWNAKMYLLPLRSAGEMAQRVQWLLHEHKDLSSDPQGP